MENKKLNVMLKYLGITETAKLLGCSRMTLHNLLQKKYTLTDKMVGNIEQGFEEFCKVLVQELADVSEVENEK